MASVYFIGPVSMINHAGGPLHFFPAVAMDKVDQNGTEVNIITECWLIVGDGDVSEVKLRNLKRGDRLQLMVHIHESEFAELLFHERNGWYVTSLNVTSRDHSKFQGTEVAIPDLVDLPSHNPDVR